MLSTCACLALLLASARTASAQNLLTNPNFDTDLSNWSIVIVTATFDGTAGSPSPGSARWTDTVGSNLTVFSGVGQCVAVTPGNTYDFGGQLLLSGAPVGGGVRVALALYGTPTCTAPSAQGNDFSASLVTTTGSWQPSTGQFTVPAGTFGIRLMGGETTGPTAGDFTVNLDSAFFALSTLPPVPTMSGWWLTILGVALAGMAAMRRLRAA